MRSLILALGEMAKLEQERAAEVHPPFASAHEGYAHIQEEKEEAKAELDYIEVQTGLLWGEIKRKGIGLEAVDRIEDAALRGRRGAGAAGGGLPEVQRECGRVSKAGTAKGIRRKYKKTSY